MVRKRELVERKCSIQGMVVRKLTEHIGKHYINTTDRTEHTDRTHRKTLYQYHRPVVFFPRHERSPTD